MYFPTSPSSTNELSYTVSSWMRNPTTGVSFNTVLGDTINIATDQSKLTVIQVDGTVLMSRDGTDSSGRRRLGFFSALRTSGSFVMMQAGGF